jgi:hypothetical protein
MGSRSHGGCHRWCAGVVLAFSAVATLWLAPGANATGRHVILSPKPGQVVRAGPVKVRVRAGKGTSVRARLNGRPASERFSGSKHGVRKLIVSPDHGLRFGTNVLRIRLSGGKSDRVRFRVSAERPLAAAGPDTAVTLGEPITLDGRHSIGKPQNNGRRLHFHWRVLRAPKHSRLRRKRRAHAASSVPLVAHAADAGVDDSDSDTTAFTPDQPGDYDVQLGVTDADGSTGLDVARYRVLNPPLVDVDTMAQFAPPTQSSDQNPTPPSSDGPTNQCELSSSATDIPAGTPGIKVGDLFCPADPTKWLQVVVLWRSTTQDHVGLQPATDTPNQNFDCPAATASTGVTNPAAVQQCINRVQTFIGTLNSSYLVIASSQRPNTSGPCQPSCSDWTAEPGVGVVEALTGIGVTVPQWKNASAQLHPVLRGRISAIGVPGYAAGSATVNVEPDQADIRFDGDLAGHLIVDNNGNYGFLTPKVPFLTQTAASTDDQSVIQVGDNSYTAPIQLDPNQNGQGGFQVVVLDQGDLSPVVDRPDLATGKSYWFPTGLQNYDSGEPARLNNMADVLQKANASGRDLVIISSRGNPAAQGAGQNFDANWQALSGAVRNLVDQVEALGGTRTAAFQALTPFIPNSGASYTLIGWSGAGVAHGVEAQGQGATAARALNTAALKGNFERADNGFAYKVSNDTAPSTVHDIAPGNQTHVAGEKLDDALVQAPEPWPDANDAAQQAAIRYIADQKFNGDDIRTDYWLSGNESSWWSAKLGDIDAVTYPNPPNPNFNATDLAGAKKELKREITWLIAVQGFTQKLAKPFNAQAGVQQWADFNAIATNVNAAAKQGSSSETKAELIAKAVFDGAREAAADIPVIGEGIGVFNTIYNTSMEVATIANEGGESADDSFPVAAADVGSELVKRLTAAYDTLTTRITNAIAADYGKLKTVGSCVLLDKDNCPDDPEAWKVEDPDQTSAYKALRVGAQIEAYSAIVPARWTLWQLGASCPNSVNFTCWDNPSFQGDGFGGLITGFISDTYYCPFIYEPASAELVRPLYRDIPFNRNPSPDVWQAYALGNLGPENSVTAAHMENPSDFLPRLFGPPDPGGVIEKGGLGVQRERFFLRNFSPKLMGAGGQSWPITSSTPSWFGRNTNCRAS